MSVRIIAALAAAAALMAGLVYVSSRLERANEADRLEKEVAAVKAQAAADKEGAAKLETQLQAARLEASELNRKWSRIRAGKDRNVCVLDADTLGVLESATRPR